MIPIIFQTRKNSQRCQNKCLREFHNGLSITELAASKYAGRKDVYIAAYEPEFRDIARKYDINFIQRTYESSIAEAWEEVLSYVKDLDCDDVCSVNVCTPFLRAKTVDDAIAEYTRQKCNTLLTICETTEVVFDHQKRPVNEDATLFNGKLRKPIYWLALALVVYNKSFAFKHKTYFKEYLPGDPYLHPIPYLETLDIDTEDQFCIIKGAYDYHANQS